MDEILQHISEQLEKLDNPHLDQLIANAKSQKVINEKRAMELVAAEQKAKGIGPKIGIFTDPE